MLSRVKLFVGDLWSKTTTVSLGLAVAILPALQAIDPELLPSWAKLAIALLGVVVVVLRFVAPPPPSVTIKAADMVTVNHLDNSVTISKAETIPNDIKSKWAGEKV